MFKINRFQRLLPKYYRQSRNNRLVYLQSVQQVPTWEWKARANISPNFFAYISDRPVSVAYSMVALILRDSACPNSFDVNFTALMGKRKNIVVLWINFRTETIEYYHVRLQTFRYLAICLKWNFFVCLFSDFPWFCPFFQTCDFQAGSF